MLYFLAEYINEKFNPPGFNIFRYLTFRSALAAITALIFTFIVGPRILNYLKKKQIGEAKKKKTDRNFTGQKPALLLWAA